jgi:hypothetical protein
MASSGGLSALALAEMAGGAILAWSGIANASLTATLRSLIEGKAPAGGTGNEPIVSDVTASPAGSEPGVVNADTGSGSAAANKVLGQFMAAGYGWTGQNWAYLESGWQEESGWSATAINGTWPDCAYGIPQANPGSKMPKAAWPSYAGGDSSAYSQIAWGLAYIKSTYGSPVNVPGWSASGPLPGYEGY